MIKKISLSDYLKSIDEINLLLPHMVDIQKYNQYMIGELNKLRPIKGKRILDLGASKYGYALV